jgi:hypothetical protein
MRTNEPAIVNEHESLAPLQTVRFRVDRCVCYRRQCARSRSAGHEFLRLYRGLQGARPTFEAQTGNTLKTAWGPSMGNAPEAIPNRLARGEPADVVIMVGYALDKLIKEGKVIPDSRVELADSRIGVAVRAGAPKPDISTEDALRKTLLQARSVAYSDSASGVYVQNELFKRVGIEEQIRPKAKMIPKIPVASVVASGEYELGFQQVSELLPVQERCSSARFLNRCSPSRVLLAAFRSAPHIHARRRRCLNFSRHRLRRRKS